MDVRTVKSTAITADAAILARRGWYYGAIVYGTGALGVGTVDIYDNASAASGTKLLSAVMIGAAPLIPALLSTPVYCTNGIYVDLTTATVTVYYSDSP